MNVFTLHISERLLQQDALDTTITYPMADLGTVLDITNAVCQVIMTFAAVIAIIITIKQIQTRNKSDLKVSYTCGMGAVGRNDGYQIVIGVGITLRNIGLAPVYYDDCGLVFVGDKKASHRKKYKGIMATKSVEKQVGVLQPGESTCESIYMIDDLLQRVNNNGSVLEADKVYIYIELCSGKKLYWYTGDNYKSFVDKYNQVKEKHTLIHIGANPSQPQK